MTIDLQNAPATETRDETRDATSQWNEPTGIGPRGTLIVLIGRGETGEVYTRFGSRIAADTYRVRTVVDAAGDPHAARSASRPIRPNPLMPMRVVIPSSSFSTLARHVVSPSTTNR